MRFWDFKDGKYGYKKREKYNNKLNLDFGF